eukprot:9499585-Pyramimonas_sp.AAC.1
MERIVACSTVPHHVRVQVGLAQARHLGKHLEGARELPIAEGPHHIVAGAFHQGDEAREALVGILGPGRRGLQAPARPQEGPKEK